MLFNSLEFLDISFIDILDILIVTILIFQAFRWLRGTSAMNIFTAIFSLYAVRVVAAAFNMKLISSLLGAIIDVGIIALIVIFQPEIRRFLIKLGKQYRFSENPNNLISKIFGYSKSKMDNKTIREISGACRIMSSQKTGALIVIPNKVPIDDIISTGDRIDATISKRLIINLFFKNSPLHDGAAIINTERIIAARCTLPITEKENIPASYGMRHKAAIGISEVTDAEVIVISEETGNISFIKGGELTPVNNINELNLLLNSLFKEEQLGGEKLDK